MADGLIAFYNLQDWWENTFSSAEKKYIIAKYQVLGASGSLLVEGERTNSKADFIYLAELLGWFQNQTDYELSIKIAEKAESLFKTDSVPVLDLHFYYQSLLRFYYRNREKANCYEKAKEYCFKQIEISEKAKKAFKKEYPKDPLPNHVGFKQLCIIYEKENEYEKSIELAEKAKKQGWGGDDWEKRIEKLQKKIDRF